jgi:hypothetical protein
MHRVSEYLPLDPETLVGRFEIRRSKALSREVDTNTLQQQQVKQRSRQLHHVRTLGDLSSLVAWSDSALTYSIVNPTHLREPWPWYYCGCRKVRSQSSYSVAQFKLTWELPRIIKEDTSKDSWDQILMYPSSGMPPLVALESSIMDVAKLT